MKTKLFSVTIADCEDLSDYDGEFIEAMRNWQGNWTERQASYFDRVWEKYYA